MRNTFYFQAHALFVSLGWFCWVRFVVSVPVPSWRLYHQKARHFGEWHPVALVNTWEINLIVTMLQRSLKQERPLYSFHWINICGACFNLRSTLPTIRMANEDDFPANQTQPRFGSRVFSLVCCRSRIGLRSNRPLPSCILPVSKRVIQMKILSA